MYKRQSPHIGHAYEKILTDVIARYKRLSGVPVHFVTGLDEHGQKVQMSAHKKGVEPIEICDSLAVEFKLYAKNSILAMMTISAQQRLGIRKSFNPYYKNCMMKVKYTKLIIMVFIAFVRNSLLRKKKK